MEPKSVNQTCRWSYLIPELVLPRLLKSPADLRGVGLDLALVARLAEECHLTEAGVLTGVLCWEDGVEEVRPSIIELDMEEDIESVRDCGPEFCLEAESLVRSEKLDRGRVWDWRGWRRDDWCSW